jgi:hypothetical protein
MRAVFIPQHTLYIKTLLLKKERKTACIARKDKVKMQNNGSIL